MPCKIGELARKAMSITICFGSYFSKWEWCGRWANLVTVVERYRQSIHSGFLLWNSTAKPLGQNSVIVSIQDFIPSGMHMKLSSHINKATMLMAIRMPFVCLLEFNNGKASKASMQSFLTIMTRLAMYHVWPYMVLRLFGNVPCTTATCQATWNVQPWFRPHIQGAIIPSEKDISMHKDVPTDIGQYIHVLMHLGQLYIPLNCTVYECNMYIRAWLLAYSG